MSQYSPGTPKDTRKLALTSQNPRFSVNRSKIEENRTISELYLARWDIEVFFKHIKQHLKIKTFVGTCPNAILIQIWTAMIAILLLKYLQNKAKYPWHLSNLVAFLRIKLFVKIDLWKWVNYPFKPPKPAPMQLAMF